LELEKRLVKGENPKVAGSESTKPNGGRAKSGKVKSKDKCFQDN